MRIMAYHGSKVKIEEFFDSYINKQGILLEGPGIYFTTSREDAERYGEFVHQVAISPIRLLGNAKPGPKLVKLCYELIQYAPDWEDDALAFDPEHEDPHKGMLLAVELALERNHTEKDLVQQVWIEFYKYQPTLFTRNMSSLGVSGLVVNIGNGVTHYVMYDPGLIEILHCTQLQR